VIDWPKLDAEARDRLVACHLGHRGATEGATRLNVASYAAVTSIPC